MGTWSGEADKDAESAGGGGGNFTPAPRGIYTLQVADFKEGMTRESNRPKVDLECEIADEGPCFGKKVWVTITQIKKGDKGHGLMLHSLHAFGVELDGGAYEFDTSVLQGAQARALLGVTTREKVKNSRTYVNEVNFVEELYTDKHPEPTGDLPAPREQKKAPAQAMAQPAAGPKPHPNVTKVFGTGAKKDEVPF